MNKTSVVSINRLKRNHIQCPNCRSRVIDASAGTRTQILTLSENQTTSLDYYMKCNKCGIEIGLKKLQ